MAVKHARCSVHIFVYRLFALSVLGLPQCLIRTVITPSLLQFCTQERLTLALDSEVWQIRDIPTYEARLTTIYRTETDVFFPSDQALMPVQHADEQLLVPRWIWDDEPLLSRKIITDTDNTETRDAAMNVIIDMLTLLFTADYYSAMTGVIYSTRVLYTPCCSFQCKFTHSLSRTPGASIAETNRHHHASGTATASGARFAL